ncbi:MAG: LemA protein [Gaiellales bacterium]|jgi:LemA protein|nr:LemA protein [Gaiellales bacterium]
MGVALLVIAAIVILVIIFLIVQYNGMIRGRNKVDEAWSGIDVQLKRRHDLIPNLVESVKGYATHERETFQQVTDARAQAMGASGPAQSGVAEGFLSQALGRLFAVAEAYPELRASENFQQLQNELTNTEDQISASRRIYNGNVQSYNTRIQVFPNSVIAGAGGFTVREYFEIETPADRQPVMVDFSTPPPSVPAAAPAEPRPTEPPPTEPPARPEPPASS